jgi:diphthamide biosynthesis methyltransferase
MFYVIGLGLSDEKDITVKGLEVRSTAIDIR